MVEEKIMDCLDIVYEKALNGEIIPGERSIKELANDYLSKSKTREEAIENLIKYQMILSGTSGFVTGLGNIKLLPITLPLNVISSIYIQLRMIAAIAYINGYDIECNQVKIVAYACLTGSSLVDIFKDLGIKISEKIAIEVLKKLPRTMIVNINKAVGFRLVTKFGTKGLINLSKLIPTLSAFICGGVDIFSTMAIANIAKQTFKLEEVTVLV